MRQKNLFVIIVLPTYFLLDKYVALWRARGLVHVYLKNGKRGQWVFFNRKKKKLLYLRGKKEYSYGIIKSGFYGRFLDRYMVSEKDYREKKGEALKHRDRTRYNKHIRQRNICIKMLYEENGFSSRELSKELKGRGFDVTHNTIAEIVRKTR